MREIVRYTCFGQLFRVEIRCRGFIYELFVTLFNEYELQLFFIGLLRHRKVNDVKILKINSVSFSLLYGKLLSEK